MAFKGRIPWPDLSKLPPPPKVVENAEKPKTPPLPRQRGMGRGQLLQHVRSIYGDRQGEAKLREQLRNCKTLCDYSNDAIERRYNRGMPNTEETTTPRAVNKSVSEDAYKSMTSAKKYNGRRKYQKGKKSFPPADHQKPEVMLPPPVANAEGAGSSGYAGPSEPGNAWRPLPGNAGPSEPRNAWRRLPFNAWRPLPGNAGPSEPRNAWRPLPGNAGPSEPGNAWRPLPNNAWRPLPNNAGPSEPGNAGPSEPGNAGPSEPGSAVPSEPGNAWRPLPANAVPSEPGNAGPSEPGHAVPSEPGNAVPSEPGNAVPSEPGNAVPSEPGNAGHSSPGGPSRLLSDNVQLKYRNALIQNLKDKKSCPPLNEDFPPLQ